MPPRSSMLVGVDSHKKIASSEPAILRFYYSFPYALFIVCAANEGFLVGLFLHATVYVRWPPLRCVLARSR